MRILTVSAAAFVLLGGAAFANPTNGYGNNGYSPVSDSRTYLFERWLGPNSPHALPGHQLVKEIRRQGYADVTSVTADASGTITAVATTYDGQQVVLTVDPYTGRVLGQYAYF